MNAINWAIDSTQKAMEPQNEPESDKQGDVTVSVPLERLQEAVGLIDEIIAAHDMGSIAQVKGWDRHDLDDIVDKLTLIASRFSDAIEAVTK